MKGEYMLYQISNGAVAFGDDVILHSIDFEIRNTEKIAIVGRNGCGKTTLLKLISGEVEMESSTAMRAPLLQRQETRR